MFLFKKSKNQNQSAMATALSHHDKANIAKLLLGLVAMFNMLGRASAVCFESSAGNDYTLDCSSGETDIFNKILSDCGAYQTENPDDDCATFFTESLHFCKGIFGDSVCTLTYHDGVWPDDCITATVANHCENNVVTGLDIFAILAIASTAIAIAAVITACNRHRCRKVEPEELIPLATPMKQMNV